MSEAAVPIGNESALEAAAPPSRIAVVAGEIAKVPAFLRRDFLIAWSYRFSFFSDLMGIAVTVITFYFVGQMVDPSNIPEYGGRRVTYMEFVIVGILLASFLQVGSARVRGAVRNEQMMGTLETLLMTPTAPMTIHVGSVAYDLIYVPIRTLALIVLAAFAFGLDFRMSGVVPAAIVLLAFLPFIWGLGLAGAAAVITLKRGSGGVILGTTLLALTSGAYFPLDLFPDWIAGAAEFNPVAVTIQGMRDALLGGLRWSGVGEAVAILFPLSVLSLALGVAAVRLALRRERGTGTLGLY